MLHSIAFIYRILFTTLKWLISYRWPRWNDPQLLAEIEKFYEKVQLWEASNGRLWTAHRVKSMRLTVTRAFSGHPLPEPLGFSAIEGLPAVLPEFLRQGLKDRDPDAFRLAVTMLSVTRMYMGGEPVSLKDIETPSKAESLDLSPVYQEMISTYRLRTWSPNWVSYHWTAKMGPKGPALAYCVRDALELPDTLVDSLVTLAGRNFDRLLKKLRGLPTDVLSRINSAMGATSQDKILRRISIKPDRECKSRPFAILDYMSQTALRPLHELLFDQLRKIPNDRTFTQGSQLLLSPPPGHSYHSLDLKSATDRFPISSQLEVLRVLIGDDKAAAWANIMVGYPYRLDDKVVYYRAGQPMGAYSSWALFTLTHHVVVHWCAKSLGLKITPETYAILGDDIVIAHDGLASSYRAAMSRLGVEISESKTHVSKDTYEFAKRWFHKGEEISPFPLHGLVENRDRYYAIYETLRQASQRGYPLPNSWQPSQFFSGLLEALGYKGRLVPYILERIQLIHQIPTSSVSPEELAERARAFWMTSRASFSCSWSEQTLSALFGFAASSAWFKEISAEAERIEKRLSEMSDLFIETLTDVLGGSDDQSELEDLFSILPPVAALQERAQQAAEVIDIDVVGEEDESPDNPSVSIWDRAGLLDFTPLPRLHGIVPMRSSTRRAASRSHWALEVSRALRTRGFLVPSK